MKNSRTLLKIILVAPLILFAFNCTVKQTDDVVTKGTGIVNAAEIEKGGKPAGGCTLTCVGEKSLVLDTHTLGISSAQAERTTFTTSVLAGLSQTYSVNKQADNVAYSQLCILKRYADAIPSSCPTASTITGLRISFGLAADFKRIKLIYEPIKLCLTQSLTANCEGTFVVVTNSVGVLYTYTNNAFVTLSVTTAIADTMRYMRNIKIQHTPGGAFEPFRVNPMNELLSDVKSVIFSFQEIEALYNQNDKPHYPDHISFWNSLKDFPVGTIPRRKHSVFMGPEALNLREEDKVFVFPGPYTGAYANLAHLCPPHCSSNLAFKLCK